MKSLSKLNIVILFLLTCIGLTACNSGGGISTPVPPTISLTSPTPTTSPTTPITLTFSEAVSGVNK